MNNTNLVVVIRNGVKRISLQRTLCSQIVYEGKCSIFELNVIFQNQLWLQRKCLTDDNFSKKFGKSLEEISIYLKKANFSRGLTPGALSTLRSNLKSLTDFIYPQRNLAAMKSKFANCFYVRPYRQQGVDIKSLPPKRYIGKGYGDKGTARDPAKDGSPSWQEITNLTTKYNQLIHRYKNELSRETKEDVRQVLEEEIDFYEREIKKIAERNPFRTNSTNAKRAKNKA